MSMLRSAALVAAGLSLPFTAWGLSTGPNLDQSRIDALSGAQVPPGMIGEATPEIVPPQCDLTSPGDAAQGPDAHAAACCWFFYVGRWWCVAC